MITIFYEIAVNKVLQNKTIYNVVTKLHRQSIFFQEIFHKNGQT